MAWYDEAIFYHIYPLGLLDAPKVNTYEQPVHRLNNLIPWVEHIKNLGFNALYIGPLFESVGHGYETTDYYKLDSRLGTNEDLKNFVSKCHEAGIKVIFDGVFNHTGRDFFAFKDIQQNRESSPYKDWYCNVNFYGNTEYNDGFSYENWGGYNLLVKLNQRNPAVQNYIREVISFWVKEFDVDGIRLDTADVLDFDFMKVLHQVGSEVKPDFYLMGEVIHGDYTRWVNGEMLSAVTNYTLHKALYSGHNDHNYFEIAHTVKRLNDMGSTPNGNLRLYNFVDNHDVERIQTKLLNKAHFIPVHILLYTLPGVPSIYYGSEFAIEGRKWRGGTDEEIRPALDLCALQEDAQANAHAMFIKQLGYARRQTPALSYGYYKELLLTNRQYIFARILDGNAAVIAVNNDDSPYSGSIHVDQSGTYTSALTGNTVQAENGMLNIHLAANSGDILIPNAVSSEMNPDTQSMNMLDACLQEEPDPVQEVQTPVQEEPQADTAADETQTVQPQNSTENENAEEDSAVLEHLSYEEMTVKQLQTSILLKMAKNGPVTDQMRRDVEQNIWKDSLINWVRSFDR